MSDYEKTSRAYLEAWRTSQAEMQQLRDLLDAEREKVRVLREALEEITEANEQTPVKTYQRMEDIARKALATTEDAK